MYHLKIGLMDTSDTADSDSLSVYKDTDSETLSQVSSVSRPGAHNKTREGSPSLAKTVITTPKLTKQLSKVAFGEVKVEEIPKSSLFPEYPLQFDDAVKSRSVKTVTYDEKEVTSRLMSLLKGAQGGIVLRYYRVRFMNCRESQ